MSCGNPTANLSATNKRYKTGSQPKNFIFTSVTTIKCVTGYIFEDLSDENVMNCTTTGIWSSIPSCIRMLQLTLTDSIGFI